MKRFLLLTLILFLLAATSRADTIQPPRGFVGKLYAGTLALYGTKDGITRFLCTAEPFEKISGGYHLISAGHCVQLVPVDVKFSVADNIGGPLMPVRVMKAVLENGVDFSEFEFKTNRDYPIFDLGDEHDARVGEPVINPNFSAGLVKQVSLGAISSDVIPPSEQCPVDKCAGDFLVQVSDTGGASGSAVVSVKTHQVIGLVVWRLDEPIGIGVEPISRFYKFLAGPTQIHPAIEEDTEGLHAGIQIPADVYQDHFGESHPFTLTVHGPNPRFTQEGYNFVANTFGLELSDEYYYAVPVFIQSNEDETYSLVSTKDGVSVPVVTLSEASAPSLHPLNHEHGGFHGGSRGQSNNQERGQRNNQESRSDSREFRDNRDGRRLDRNTHHRIDRRQEVREFRGHQEIFFGGFWFSCGYYGWPAWVFEDEIYVEMIGPNVYTVYSYNYPMHQISVFIEE